MRKQRTRILWEMNNFTEKFKELVEIMDTLRAEGGCPWDREQDHKSLVPYLIEEAYEVIESIEEGSPEKLREELGDLLLQIVFHSRIAKESGQFEIGGVLDSINEKLIRRHPHIFGDAIAETSEQVLKNWEEIKLREKGGRKRESLMDGIPIDMPALLYARRLQERAAQVGFDWESVGGVIEKLREEIEELGEATKKADREMVMDELGDLFFALVNVGRWMDINPEEALRQTSKKFVRRFKHIEKTAKTQGRALSEMSLDEMEAIWQGAKLEEGK
jgi:tetrapyrrole methylase family protein / MazG family protein